MDLKIFFANIANVTLLLTMVFELAQCFFGYRLKKILTAINGFLFGFSIGSLFVALFFAEMLGENFLTVLLITSVTGGIAFSSALMTGFLKISTPYVVMTVSTVFVIMGMIVQFKTTKKHR